MDKADMTVNPYAPTAHVGEQQVISIGPPIDGSISFKGRMDRDDLVRVLADPHLATGCLMSSVFVTALVLLSLAIFYSIGEGPSLWIAIIPIALFALINLFIRSATNGKSQAKQMIQRMPDILELVHGEITEQGWQVSFGKVTFAFPWTNGIRVAANERGLQIKPWGIPLAKELFGDSWGQVDALMKVADQRLSKHEKKEAPFNGLLFSEPSFQAGNDFLHFAGRTTRADFYHTERILYMRRPLQLVLPGLFFTWLVVQTIFALQSGDKNVFWLPISFMVTISLGSLIGLIIERYRTHLTVQGCISTSQKSIELISPSMHLTIPLCQIEQVLVSKHYIRLRPASIKRDWVLTPAMFAGPDDWHQVIKILRDNETAKRMDGRTSN